MIRVAHVITIYRGAVGILESKLVALDACGDLDVTVITAPPPEYPELPAARVRQISIPMVRPIRPWADLRSIWALYRILRKERFDIVHTHSSKAGIVGALAAWPARVPIIYHTYHGLPFFEGQNRVAHFVYRLLEWLACRLRDEVFSQNRRDMPACVRLMGDERRVHFEGNGVDPDEVRRRAEQDRERADADYPAGKFRLLLVSRLESVKRVGDFLAACEILVREGVDVSAVVAGYGPLKEALEREIDERGLRERVRLLGWVPHVAALLAASDVVLLTSEKEGIPRSLIEAMALNKPVVATDVLGTQELVVDGETGYLTPLGDTQALVERMRRLAQDAELRARFGRAGAARVEEHFHDGKIAAFLHEKYRQAVGRG